MLHMCHVHAHALQTKCHLPLGMTAAPAHAARGRELYTRSFHGPGAPAPPRAPGPPAPRARSARCLSVLLLESILDLVSDTPLQSARRNDRGCTCCILSSAGLRTSTNMPRLPTPRAHTTHDTGMWTHRSQKRMKKMNTPASSEGAITRAAGSEEEELLPHRSSEPTSIAIS